MWFSGESGEIVAAVPANESIPVAMSVKSKDQVRFELNLNYDDPFLKRLKRRKRATSGNKAKPPAKKVQKTKVEVPKIIWPQVQFNGVIKAKTGQSTVALITIDGHSVVLKNGEEFKGVKLLEIGNGQILLQYKKEKRTIVK